MCLLAGIMWGRYVCYDESWSLGLSSPRSEFIISDRGTFYKSSLTRRARTEIAYTMEIYISSRLSCIPLPVSPPFDIRKMGSVFFFKVSAVIPLWPFHQMIALWSDPNDGFIRTVRQPDPTGEWRNDPAEVARAVKGSNIAVIMDDNEPARYRVYYQDPELHLRERYFNHSNGQWILGEKNSRFMSIYERNERTHRVLGDFNPGVQPRGTPITAEVVHGGDVDINVTWRDARGHFAGDSWSRSSGWESSTHGGGAPLDGRDWRTFEIKLCFRIKVHIK